MQTTVLQPMLDRYHLLSLTRDTILASRNLSPEGLFGHQSQAEKVEGSALLIAPTGSGKDRSRTALGGATIINHW